MAKADTRMPGSTKMVIGLIAVIVASIGWLVYSLSSGPPTNVVIPEGEKTPTQQFMAEVVKINGEVRFQRVDAQMMGDRLVIGGGVPTAKDLQDLKELLAKIEPKVPYDFKVTVGATP